MYVQASVCNLLKEHEALYLCVYDINMYVYVLWALHYVMPSLSLELCMYMHIMQSLESILPALEDAT